MNAGADEERVLHSAPLEASDPVFASVERVTPAQFERFCRARLPSDLYHYELLRGRIVMTPPAGWPHGTVGGTVAGHVAPFVRTRKLGVVFSNGVREYWRIEPSKRTLSVFARRGKRFGEPRIVDRGFVPTAVLRGLRLPLSELFDAIE